MTSFSRPLSTYRYIKDQTSRQYNIQTDDLHIKRPYIIPSFLFRKISFIRLVKQS